MAQYTDPLAHIRIAAPCRADWERMSGNENVRFCDQCSLNVYNLSNMSKRDAESLILKTEGRLCVRYYRRADGTILTSNCPVGLQRLRRRASGVSRAVISSVLSFFAGMGALAGLQTAQSSLESLNETGVDLIDPVPLKAADVSDETPPENVEVMGKLAVEPAGGWINGQPVSEGISPTLKRFLPRARQN